MGNPRRGGGWGDFDFDTDFDGDFDSGWEGGGLGMCLFGKFLDSLEDFGVLVEADGCVGMFGPAFHSVDLGDQELAKSTGLSGELGFEFAFELFERRRQGIGMEAPTAVLVLIKVVGLDDLTIDESQDIAVDAAAEGFLQIADE